MYCKYCGKETIENEDVCDDCKNIILDDENKNRKDRKKLLIAISCIIILFIFFISIGVSSSIKSQPTQIKYDPSLYNTGITYDELARTPNNYINKKVKFSGNVIQVFEEKDEIDLRIVVNNNYDNILLVAYNPSITKERILEGDNITISGVSNGIYTYKATSGTNISAPLVSADNIELNKK